MQKVQVWDKGFLYGIYFNECEKFEKEFREFKDGDRFIFGFLVDCGILRFMFVLVKFGVLFNEFIKQYVLFLFVLLVLIEIFSVGDECGLRIFQVLDDFEVSFDVDDYFSDSSIYFSYFVIMNFQIVLILLYLFLFKFVFGVEVIDFMEFEVFSQSYIWIFKLNVGFFNNSSFVFIDFFLFLLFFFMF